MLGLRLIVSSVEFVGDSQDKAGEVCNDTRQDDSKAGKISFYILLGLFTAICFYAIFVTHRVLIKDRYYKRRHMLTFYIAANLTLLFRTMFFTDVFMHYNRAIFLLLMSLPVYFLLFTGLSYQIFLYKIMMLSQELSRDSNVDDQNNILRQERRNRVAEYAIQGIMLVVAVLYVVLYSISLANNDSFQTYAFTTICIYSVIFGVLIVTSIIFLRKMRLHWGMYHLMGLKCQIFIVLWLIGIAYLYRIIYNSWLSANDNLCSFINDKKTAYALWNAFEYIICDACPILAVFSVHLYNSYDQEKIDALKASWNESNQPNAIQNRNRSSRDYQSLLRQTNQSQHSEESIDERIRKVTASDPVEDAASSRNDIRETNSLDSNYVPHFYHNHDKKNPSEDDASFMPEERATVNASNSNDQRLTLNKEAQKQPYTNEDLKGQSKPSFDPVNMQIYVDDSMSTKHLQILLDSENDVYTQNKTPRSESKKVFLPQTSPKTTKDPNIELEEQKLPARTPARLSKSTLNANQQEMQVPSERNTSSNQVSNSFVASQQDDYNMRQLPSNKYLSDSSSLTNQSNIRGVSAAAQEQQSPSAGPNIYI